MKTSKYNSHQIQRIDSPESAEKTWATEFVGQQTDGFDRYVNELDWAKLDENWSGLHSRTQVPNILVIEHGICSLKVGCQTEETGSKI